ncbi:hypothetical protein C1646_683156 [Rhizophagus diaphanus]|nr:hypothetical protein C1646_683156 [Rhizophagus diaphanus] [Rhizophagus sp. MUCL 43196]
MLNDYFINFINCLLLVCLSCVLLCTFKPRNNLTLHMRDLIRHIFFITALWILFIAD